MTDPPKRSDPVRSMAVLVKAGVPTPLASCLVQYGVYVEGMLDAATRGDGNAANILGQVAVEMTYKSRQMADAVAKLLDDKSAALLMKNMAAAGSGQDAVEAARGRVILPGDAP